MEGKGGMEGNDQMVTSSSVGKHAYLLSTNVIYQAPIKSKKVCTQQQLDGNNSKNSPQHGESIYQVYGSWSLEWTEHVGVSRQ